MPSHFQLISFHLVREILSAFFRYTHFITPFPIPLRSAPPPHDLSASPPSLSCDWWLPNRKWQLVCQSIIVWSLTFLNWLLLSSLVTHTLLETNSELRACYGPASIFWYQKHPRSFTLWGSCTYWSLLHPALSAQRSTASSPKPCWILCSSNDSWQIWFISFIHLFHSSTCTLQLVCSVGSSIVTPRTQASAFLCSSI